MLCPTCKIELKMADRTGVEIDYCPQCRGVWLDRGELDKIVERSVAAPGLEYEEAPVSGGDPRRGYAPHRHRKKSFLGDMFDF